MKCLLKALVAGLLLLGMQSPTQAQILLSYWDFNNDSPSFNGATNPATLGSFNTTAASFGEVYTAANNTLSSNTANGAIYSSSAIQMDFTNLTTVTAPAVVNGKSGGTQATTATGTGGFGTYADSTLNQVSGDATTGNSMIVMAPGGSVNGKYITLTLDSLGYNNLTLSYATRLTNGNLGTEAWSYSLDGTTYNTLSSFTTTGTGSFVLETLNLSSLSSNALNNQGTFYLRETFNMALNGSFAFDNLQLTGASAVPEPSSFALMGAGLLALVVVLQRKRAC
jgi:hypothetical protein